MKTVIVTGGAGFIGSHLAKAHLKQGDKVIVIDNLQTGSRDNIASLLSNPNFTFIEGDICHLKNLNELVKGADRIYHMAANVGQRFVLAHPVETIVNNIDGAKVLLEALKETKSAARLLLASTSEVYCHIDIKPNQKANEEMAPLFPSGKFRQETYPLAKFVNEVMALSYVWQYGVDCTIARLFNTVGPNQSPAYGMVMPNFMRQALSGEPITVFGDGKQTRSFSSVHDTVKALMLVLDNPASRGEIINVGDDKECSILDLAKLVKRLTGSESEIRFVDYQKAYGVEFVDVKRRCPDLSKLKILTGFTPSISLEQVIQEMIPLVKSTL
jgi:UDP-glucose 4-epimerase